MSREDATLIILAGGASQRMGRPKHLLPVAGGTLIEAVYNSLCWGFRETVVVGSVGPVLGNARQVCDVPGPRSPLLGIYSGLLSCKTDAAFVVACDMPYLRPALVDQVLSVAWDVDVAVPMARGHHEPLCAAYRRSALPAINRALKRGELKITDLYRKLAVRRVPEADVRHLDPGLRSFVNLNTPREVAASLGLATGGERTEAVGQGDSGVPVSTATCGDSLSVNYA